MSWAYGVDKNGREVGYSVPDKCNLEGCEVEIDRGIAFRCGGILNLHEEYGCGRFVCAAHMYCGDKDQLCEECREKEPIDDLEDE